jgi:hypothetical protein
MTLLLTRSDYTPAVEGPGLFARCSLDHGGTRVRGALWVHGALALPNTLLLDLDVQNRWLRSLNVLVVEEANEHPSIVPVFENRSTLRSHTSEIGTQAGQAVVLPFSFDLAALLSVGLPDDSVWVRLSARELCTAPMRVTLRKADRASGLERLTGEPSFPFVDDLLAAYDAMAGGQPKLATHLFTAALQDSVLGNDLDCPHLLHAATAATAAAASADPDEARALQTASVQWLEAHIRNFGEALAWTQQALASGPAQPQKDRLIASRRYLATQLGLSNNPRG